MKNRIEVKNANTGLGASGYTVRAYAWSSGSSGYSGAAVYTFSDNGDGIYYAEVSQTFKATIVITNANTTVITVPSQTVGSILWGDNILTLTPGGAS
jgi:hypothetical protein